MTSYCVASFSLSHLIGLTMQTTFQEQLQEFPYLLEKILANKKFNSRIHIRKVESRLNPLWRNILQYHSDVDIVDWLSALSRVNIDTTLDPNKQYDMVYTIALNKPVIEDLQVLKKIQLLASQNIHIIKLEHNTDFTYYQELIESTGIHEATDLRRWREYLCCQTRTITRVWRRPGILA